MHQNPGSKGIYITVAEPGVFVLNHHTVKSRTVIQELTIRGPLHRQSVSFCNRHLLYRLKNRHPKQTLSRVQHFGSKSGGRHDRQNT